MSSVIKFHDASGVPASVAFNFEDMTRQADAYLKGIRAQAAKIIEQATEEAAAVRQRAEDEGLKAAEITHDAKIGKHVGEQMQTLQPAIRSAIEEIQQSKQAWLTRWEQQAVTLAAAIAEKIIHRELEHAPEITLSLVKEALSLAAGGGEIRLMLHPHDRKTLESQIDDLVAELGKLAPAEIVANPAIERGSCRVETRFGSIDHQWSAQLARIVEELA